MTSEDRMTRWHDIDQRFWSRVHKAEGCWLWQGPIEPTGYTRRIGHQGKYWRGHQLAYHLLVGEVPDGMVLDHLCRVRHCVNPDHLEPVTPQENTRRGVAARWTEPCPNGHEPECRKQLPSGKNICAACQRDNDARRYERDGARRRAAARQRYAERKASR